MYESLTAFIPELSKDKYGELVIDKNNDRMQEHPEQVRVTSNSRTAENLREKIYQFADEHPDFGLRKYEDILNTNGIQWSLVSMKQADVSSLDGKTLMALLLGAVRAERYCYEDFLELFGDDRVIKWLERLKKIDEEAIT